MEGLAMAAAPYGAYSEQEETACLWITGFFKV